MASKAHETPEEKRTERRHVPGIVMPFLARELMCMLRPAEWKLWSCLYLHANRDGICCVKNETLIAEIEIGWNTFHKAKSELIEARWLENLGQRNKRGANIYRVLIGAPNHVSVFVDALWNLLNQEDWWNSRLDCSEKFNYSDNQIDWLVLWRVIRALKECDSSWKPRSEISAELASKAQQSLLETLRHAAESLGPGRGSWYLWGDGFDSNAAGLLKNGTPQSNNPGLLKTGNPGLLRTNNPA